MTQAELKSALKNLGLPVAYSEFVDTKENPAPNPPFITYQFTNDSDIKADNQNYIEIGNYQVELYTSIKDPATEKKVQDLFKSLRIPYTKAETRIQSEDLNQVVYLIQII